MAKDLRTPKWNDIVDIEYDKTNDMIGALEMIVEKQQVDKQKFDQHDIGVAVDSACFDHACPEWFAPGVPVTPAKTC